MTAPPVEPKMSSSYRAAREALAHRARNTAVIDVAGADRESFLQGQLTQEVRDLAVGEGRAAAALTPKGKLIFVARLIGMADRFRLLLPWASREPALAHLRKFAAFQKVTVEDGSDLLLRIGLYGPEAPRIGPPPGGWALSAADELSAEWLLPRGRKDEALQRLARNGSIEIDEDTADVLRVEAGRPRFGRDIDGTNLPDEAGLENAISRTKGCYVGQEIVARRQTYGRMPRRLVGFRFPDGPLRPGAVLRRAGSEETEPGKAEAGRVTSLALSPRLGAIGLGFASHDVLLGDRLVAQDDSLREAIASAIPFA
jgi:folate-binding protein YgfZ